PHLVVGIALVATHAGDGGQRVAHAVDAQLGPAHAPQVVGYGAAVDALHDALELLEARRHAAVHLAELQRLDRGVARHGALHASRVDQVDGEVVADDAADRAVPSDHRGDALRVDAVLGGDDVAVGCQVRRYHGRGPGGVVGLDRHDGYVDRRSLCQALQLRHMHGADAGLEALGGHHAEYA